ncbi:hypothetical protein KGM_214544 [Danaus plexippus plexippus]|uniref:Uncharacterized protein n=1 Tax=Danaus plexippus plexippus TaxID=278856 RepID=A0A212FF62_DANPL|nr:hypothetical protein KGM_214544 [Danaus plexippus plexippus]
MVARLRRCKLSSYPTAAWKVRGVLLRKRQLCNVTDEHVTRFYEKAHFYA